MQPTPTTQPVKHLDHLNLSVADLAETARWYGAVFGFEVVERGVHHGTPWLILRAGDAMLCAYEYPTRGAPRGGQRHHLNHFALRLQDTEAFLRRAQAEGVTWQWDSPVRWPHSTAWYVIDPSGYEIECVAWHGDQIAFDPVAEAPADR